MEIKRGAFQLPNLLRGGESGREGFQLVRRAGIIDTSEPNHRSRDMISQLIQKVNLKIILKKIILKT